MALRRDPRTLETEASSRSDGVPENATIRLLMVRCGKCDAPHGPYRYSEWREGRRVVTKYLGRGDLTRKEDGAEREGTLRGGTRAFRGGVPS